MDRLGSIKLDRTWQRYLVVLAALALAAYLGQRPSRRFLVLLAAAFPVILLLREPRWGLVGLIVAALALPIEFGTGTAVTLNPATLLVPALLLLGLLDMVLRQRVYLRPSPTNRPLAWFLLAGLLSLLIGNVLWDPIVPRESYFWLVQLAQWAIFAFAAGAYWLMANWADEVWLRRAAWTFLILGGVFAVLRQVPGIGGLTSRLTTIAFIRAPFWMLLAALAGGQLLFNDALSPRWRLPLASLLVFVVFYAVVRERESASTWVGVGAALGVLGWLRWPRWRGPLVFLLVALTITGLLTTAVWEFAGGQEDWDRTGGSRLALISRVVEVTLRNPITGLGPAAYRPYASMKPLRYRGALWFDPRVNSHNNYVDIFAHVGLVGLALFGWFAVELWRVGQRLRQRSMNGFLTAYVNSMLAAGAASLVLMLFADWMLPFVYNIGFPGFQASLPVWLMLGGLVALDQHAERAA